jgi:hypothetical protein
LNLIDKRLHCCGQVFNKTAVLSKSLCRRGRSGTSWLAGLICFCSLFSLRLCANDVSAASEKFLGPASCSSSSCHGGASATKNQNIIWSQHDFHSRSFATLTTARSERMAEALGLDKAAGNQRCTSCHAPLHNVPASQRALGLKISEGVSCETCHGPAQSWLRSHTRPDFSHRDRVSAGMHDLQDLYVRANSCVACHQTVETDLLAAGHPELIFELDGQGVSEPKHWREQKNWSGAQTWLVGQAVALREMSWQLAREKKPNENLINRWRGLVWLMARTSAAIKNLPALPESTFRPNEENFELVKKWSDNVAKTAAKISWTQELAQRTLAALVQTAPEFSGKIPQPVQARRAERLVLALDRLALSARANSSLDKELNAVFKLVQSLPDFDPAPFAKALEQFAQKLN